MIRYKFAKKFVLFFGLLILLNSLAFSPALGQDSDKISLSLSRNVGTAIGNKISGDFTIRASGDESILSLTLLFNGSVVAKSETNSLNFRFNTKDYGVGIMNITVIGIDASDNFYQKTISRQFLDSKVDLIIGVVAGIIVIGSLTYSILKKRKASQNEKESVDEIKNRIKVDIDKDFKKK